MANAMLLKVLREVKRSSCVTHTHASLQIQSLWSIYSVNVLHYLDLVIYFNKQKTTTKKIPRQVLLTRALPDNYLGRGGETVVIQVKKIIFCRTRRLE